ncbi:aspartyl protease family protein [Flavobacterium selenitireducens]|uniref:aspartyl protease family protein n=1 Tax=Flavobacterium selenitireducens TaxID=2722704 RepID=UPI00168AA6C1|nr:aspartyl protease family protein [Flavobacterium selenitireducens]MBD3582655.1 PDZ domain-containing protein [Flavobacterium selenitireducens]
MKVLLFLLAIFLGLSAFAQSKEEIKRSTANRDKYLFAVKSEPRKFDETVAAEYVTDEILVPVTINGKTYTFLFDTGAITILSSEIVQNLGLTAVTSNKFVDSAGNTTEENFYTVPEIRFGSVAFRNVGVGSFDLSRFSQLLCRPIDGIFGSNMMRVCNWEIDYGKPSVRMSSDKIQLQNARSVPFTQNFSGTPRVTITTAGINFLADVDTGNNGSLDIPMEFFEKSRLNTASRIASSRGKGFYSLLGNALQDEHMLMADSVYIGKVLLSRRIRVSPSPMVLIGNDFFSPFGKFAINYKKGELLLPEKQGVLPPENSFGFTPLRENGKTVVGVIWKGSDAEKQGIQLQDEILTLDQIDVSTLADADWCAFRQRLIANDKVSVTVRQSDGKTLSLTLRKYNLLE